MTSRSRAGILGEISVIVASISIIEFFIGRMPDV
jgi:hypothetical protein